MMVSVIIPFYNRISYVKRAVESVINQSYTDWEIILVDDCSSDKLDIQHTLGIDYLSKIKLITNKLNLGPGLSRQAGLDVAIGEYVCFLDSDDFYHRDFLLKTLNRLLSSPKSAGAFCITVSTKGGINRGSDQPAKSIMPDLFMRNRPWETSSWLWRKTEIAAWKQLRTNEDWLFELDTAVINNNIIHISEPLCIKDDDTGENTKDLINNKLPEIHRNIVAVYAMKRLVNFSGYLNYKSIRKTVIRRLIFTSSRLINQKEERKVTENSLILFRYHKTLAVLLLFFSLTTFKTSVIGSFYKKLLNRLAKMV